MAEQTPPLSPAERAQLERRLQRLGRLLDTSMAIPGTNIRFGLDGLVGLVPGVGDVVTSAVSLYILYGAHRLGASRAKLAMMAGNVLIDALVGSVPVLGDIFDVAFKANIRNLRMLGLAPPGSSGKRETPTRP